MSGFSLCPLRYGGRLLGGGVIDDHRGVGMRLAPFKDDRPKAAPGNLLRQGRA